MLKLLWIITLIAACLAGVFLFFGVSAATGSPQEAAAAGISLGVAVIPYVLARSVQELYRLDAHP